MKNLIVDIDSISARNFQQHRKKFFYSESESAQFLRWTTK